MSAATLLFRYMPLQRVQGQIYLFYFLHFMSVGIVLHEMRNRLSFLVGYC